MAYGVWRIPSESAVTGVFAGHRIRNTHSALRTSFRIAIALVLLAGCNSPRPVGPSPRPPISASPPDPWVITTTSAGDGYRPTYLGNGYLGQVMDAAGLGMIGSGATQTAPAAGPGTGSRPAQGPQPASLAGLYNNGHLVSLPPLFPLRLVMNGQPFGADLTHLSGYKQTLDMRRGLLTTRATWNGQPVELNAFVSRDDPSLALCHVVAPFDAKVTNVAGQMPMGTELRPAPVEDRAPGEQVLTTSQSHRFVHRNTWFLRPDGAAPAGAAASTLVCETDGGAVLPHPILYRALTQHRQKPDGLFSTLLQHHTAAWQRLWASDIEIQGNPADQQLVHALMYQLLASVRTGVTPAPGFPPMGLSNPAAFGGHVFWDADTWIFPALLPLHPELARTILDYRFRTLPGAKANAAADGMHGASYAWESADTGREVATLETRHGRHVTADVARAFWQYYLATGDRAWLRQQAWPVLSATADYWLTRATRTPSTHSADRASAHVFGSPSPRIGGGGRGVGADPSPRIGRGRVPAQRVAGVGAAWEIRRVSTPDENAGLVDNSAWTNYGARENLRAATRAAAILGLPADPRWLQIADGLLIPRDASGMILEYSGYKGQPAKQADTLLLLFPGDMPLPRAEQERMFHDYVDRTIRNGPAMTESVHAVIAARLGQPEEAYRRFRQSVDPFVRPPYFSFSEKRTRDNLQFLTGAAGSLQAVLYGFAGLRLEDSPVPVFHPALPSAWSGLVLRNLAWRGRRYDVVIRRGAPARVTPCKAL